MNLKYTEHFIHTTINCPELLNTLRNHGYTKVENFHGQGHRIYKPIGLSPENTFYITLTPAYGQTSLEKFNDAKNNRILLVCDVQDYHGSYTILEDDSKYMPITGNLQTDMQTFTQRLLRAIIHITGPAQTLGISVSEYISKHLVAIS
jgi:hypothetical protein